MSCSESSDSCMAPGGGRFLGGRISAMPSSSRRRRRRRDDVVLFVVGAGGGGGGGSACVGAKGA